MFQTEGTACAKATRQKGMGNVQGLKLDQAMLTICIRNPLFFPKKWERNILSREVT